MSFICRVMIGYFDADEAVARRSAQVLRPLSGETVACLQATCHEVFGRGLALAGHLTDAGAVRIDCGSIRAEIYEVAVIAHDLFGMSVVDVAHGDAILPANDESLPPSEKHRQPFAALGIFLLTAAQPA